MKTGPKYPNEEYASRGSRIYMESVLPHMTEADQGKFAVIDIETGKWEIGEDIVEITERFHRERVNAQLWLERVGERAAFRMGGHGLYRKP